MDDKWNKYDELYEILNEVKKKRVKRAKWTRNIKSKNKEKKNKSYYVKNGVRTR